MVHTINPDPITLAESDIKAETRERARNVLARTYQLERIINVKPFSKCIIMFTVLWIVPDRIQYINDIQMFYSLLLNKKIKMIPLLMPFHNNNLLKLIKNKYGQIRVPIKTLNDYSIKNASEIISRENPDLLIVYGDRGFFHRSFIMISKKQDIPVLLMAAPVPNFTINTISRMKRIVELLKKSHTSYQKQLRQYLFYLRTLYSSNMLQSFNVMNHMIDFIGDISYGIVGSYSDYIIASTERDVNFIKKNCPSLISIRATGYSKYDFIVKYRSSQNLDAIKKEINLNFKLHNNKKNLLVISSSFVNHSIWNENTNLSVQNELLTGLFTLKDEYNIIIKLHPMEENFFKKIWRTEYDKYIKITDYNLDKLILFSDIIVSWYSTAMINVVLSLKPLIVLNFLDYISKHPISPREVQYICDENAAIEVLNVNDMLCKIHSLTDNTIKNEMMENMKKFQSKYLSEMDGKSSYRIVEFIEEILKDVV